MIHCPRAMSSLSPVPNHLGDSSCRVGRDFVLPDPHAQPPEFPQTGVGVPIPRYVLFEFGGPPLSVSCGKGRVVRTGVPEAAIDEDRDLRTDERDITASPRHFRQWVLGPIPQPQSPELSAKLHLGLGVLRLLPRHSSRRGFIGRRPSLHGPPPHSQHSESNYRVL